MNYPENGFFVLFISVTCTVTALILTMGTFLGPTYEWGTHPLEYSPTQKWAKLK
jgi:hypothetical protein